MLLMIKLLIIIIVLLLLMIERYEYVNGSMDKWERAVSRNITFTYLICLITAILWAIQG